MQANDFAAIWKTSRIERLTSLTTEVTIQGQKISIKMENNGQQYRDPVSMTHAVYSWLSIDTILIFYASVETCFIADIDKCTY